MRILMAGGGTAGHINPALAIADRIRQNHPDAEFLFVGAEGRMETRLVPAAGYAIRTMKISGFQRRLSFKNIGRNAAAAFHALTAEAASTKILREFHPDIAIGTGGYVCGPILRQAARAGIPVLVHESNAYPGMTVKMLAKYADAVMISEEAARRYLPVNARVVVTGNPLRREFLNLDRAISRRELGLDERPVILSFGGSLGAGKINEVMTEVLARSAVKREFQHIHAAGRAGYAAMKEALESRGVDEARAPQIRLRDYIDDMARCMAAADLVVSRSGAMTISELPACAKPAILIPSPNVAENHQYHNATALAQTGAAVCIEEKDLTPERLWKEIERIASAPDELLRMSRNARRHAILDASDRIYAVVMQTLKDRSK